MIDDDDEAGAGRFKWPDVPRLAFGPGPDPLLDARLDWIKGNSDRGLGYYLSAYQGAIEALYALAVERRVVVEYAMIPLAFLWRHRIELLLKDIIEGGRQLIGEQLDPEKGHDLLKLWGKARPHILPLGPVDAPELSNAEATITEFQRIDPGADGFRYPLNVRSEQNLSTAPDRINLVLFHDAMDALGNFLSGVRGELGTRLDFFQQYEMEMEREHGQAMSDERRFEMRRRYIEEHRASRT